MYLENHFFTCECAADEHTLRFIYDPDDHDFYVSVFLNDYKRWYKRVWVAIKYVFGYKCKYGHWDCILLGKKETERLRDLCQRSLDERKAHHDKLIGK